LWVNSAVVYAPFVQLPSYNYRLIPFLSAVIFT